MITQHPNTRKPSSRSPDPLIPLNQKGFGLVILVALIAISGILVTSTSLLMSNSVRQMQLQIDQTKAYYLAQAGIMRAIYNWRISSNNEINRRYAEVNTTVTGNQLFKTAGQSSPLNIVQANFVYYTFNAGQDTDWANSGGHRRLRRWRVRNIHTAVAGTGDNIIFTAVRVSWTATVGAPTLRQIRLSRSGLVIPAGAYASGTLIPLIVNVQLTPGSVLSGNNNYLEWNGTGADVNSITNVTVQWTFGDDGATEDSKSHEIVYWNGSQAGLPPAQHTFTITSTGQVNQSAGQAFKVLQTVRATVSGNPVGGGIEIIDWKKVDKNIP